jgi:hypothetical protein
MFSYLFRSSPRLHERVTQAWTRNQIVSSSGASLLPIPLYTRSRLTLCEYENWVSWQQWHSSFVTPKGVRVLLSRALETNGNHANGTYRFACTDCWDDSFYWSENYPNNCRRIFVFHQQRDIVGERNVFWDCAATENYVYDPGTWLAAHWAPPLPDHRGDCKGKVKLSLCSFLTEHHTMKAYWRSGFIAPRILDLGTRCRWVVSFTTRPLYPQGKNPWYPLVGPQSRSGRGGEERNSQPLPGLEPPDHPARSPALSRLLSGNCAVSIYSGPRA